MEFQAFKASKEPKDWVTKAAFEVGSDICKSVFILEQIQSKSGNEKRPDRNWPGGSIYEEKEK